MASLSRISSAMSRCNPSSVCVPFYCVLLQKKKTGEPDQVINKLYLTETPKELTSCEIMAPSPPVGAVHL